MLGVRIGPTPFTPHKFIYTLIKRIKLPHPQMIKSCDMLDRFSLVFVYFIGRGRSRCQKKHYKNILLLIILSCIL
jgi:hypothetical protein